MVDETLHPPRRDFYVYAIFRPDGDVCYIGKGRGGRWRQHVKRSCNRHLRSIYAKAGGDLPIVKVREGITEREAFETEKRLIAAIGRTNLGDGPLVNLTDGGEGLSGHIPNQKEIERRKYFLRGFASNRKGCRETPDQIAKKVGRKASPETRAKLSAWQLGRKMSPEARANIRAARLGKTASPEARANMSARQLGSKRSPETGTNISAAKRQANAERVRAEAGPWLIDPGPEYHARAVLYHEDARRMASQSAEQMSLDF